MILIILLCIVFNFIICVFHYYFYFSERHALFILYQIAKLNFAVMLIFYFYIFLTHLFHIFIFLNIHGVGQLAVERAEAFDSPHAYFCRCNVLESIQSEKNFLPYLLSVSFFYIILLVHSVFFCFYKILYLFSLLFYCLFDYPFIYLFTYLFTYLFIYLLIYLLIYFLTY